MEESGLLDGPVMITNTHSVGVVCDSYIKWSLLKRWLFGVPDGSLAVCSVALKAGETFRYVWRSPHGTEIGMSGVCLEFKRPDRLVATEKFDKPW